MAGIVAELDAAGVPLYAITNFSSEFWHRFRPTQEAVFAPFRDIVVSGDEKLAKPDPAIFHLALARFGLEPQEALFVDDNAAMSKPRRRSASMPCCSPMRRRSARSWSARGCSDSSNGVHVYTIWSPP